MAVPSSVEPHRADDAYGPVGRSAWLDIEWGAHRRFIEVDGRPVNIVELGNGPPLLFVHGVGGCWQNWLENLPEFARDHRVIALDLPGFGASEMPAAGVSVPTYTRTLEAVCDALSINGAAVVGNSLGGFVAAELAIACPQRVERLVLVAAAGVQINKLPLKRALDVLARAQPVYELVGGWVAAHSRAVTRRRRLRQLMFFSVAAHPEKVPWPVVAEQAAGAGRPGFLPALQAMADRPLRPRLGEIGCPTLIVWGERDRLVPVRDAGTFARRIPDARKIVYPDTGHVPMLERPARFNGDLRTFLEEPLNRVR